MLLPSALPAFECEPFRSQPPHPLHNVRRVTVCGVRIHDPLEHDGVPLCWKLDSLAQLVSPRRSRRSLLKVEDQPIMLGQFVHSAGDHGDHCDTAEFDAAYVAAHSVLVTSIQGDRSPASPKQLSAAAQAIKLQTAKLTCRTTP